MSQIFFYLLILFLPVQLGYHFWPKSAMVWGTRVDYLAPTVYLTDIIILLIIGAWGIEKISRYKDIKRLHNEVGPRFRLSVPLIFIGVFLVINCLLAKNQGAAFYKLIKIIEMGVLVLYIRKHVIARTSPQARTKQSGPGLLRFLRSLAMTIKTIDQSPVIFFLTVSVFYSSIIAIWQFFKQGSIAGIFWWLGERTFTSVTPGISQINFGGRLYLRSYATFPHPNVLAGFLVLTLPIILSFVIARRNKNSSLLLRFPPKAGEAISMECLKAQRDCFVTSFLAMTDYLFYIITFILGLIALFLTFSRTAILAFIIMMSLIIFNLNKSRFKTVSLVLILFSIICYFLFVFKINQPESISYRKQLNEIALLMIAKNPVVGVGLNNFIPAMIDYATPGQTIRFLQPVHNIYLLIGAELGIPGLIMVAVTVFSIWYKVSEKNKKQKQLQVISYGLLFTILFLGLFDHYFLTLQQGQIMLALAIGYLSKKC